ncbi:hypothetical protein ACFL43_00050 [Thermodesulfobacteriota bacterium]
MSANPDFKDLFRILNEEAVEYLIVGAHAVIFYAEPRFTKDMDVWVAPTPENAKRLWKALERFGAPLQDVSVDDFTDTDLVYQIGIEPNRIDILVGIAGVEFIEAVNNKQESTYDGVKINIIGKAELIKAKRASRRQQDLLDIERLLGGD